MFCRYSKRTVRLVIDRGASDRIEDWLKERKIPYYAPEALPSEQYGDASHPLGSGYALLAKELVAGGFLAAADVSK